jgi:hypothetical protein
MIKNIGRNLRELVIDGIKLTGTTIHNFFHCSNSI